MISIAPDCVAVFPITLSSDVVRSFTLAARQLKRAHPSTRRIAFKKAARDGKAWAEVSNLSNTRQVIMDLDGRSAGGTISENYERRSKLARRTFGKFAGKPGLRTSW